MICAGVEVKPGKPYTHRYQSSHGRLRISQVAPALPLYYQGPVANSEGDAKNDV
jgi:hypothetical protein